MAYLAVLVAVLQAAEPQLQSQESRAQKYIPKNRLRFDHAVCFPFEVLNDK